MLNVGLRIIRQAHHKWFDGVYTELCRSARHKCWIANVEFRMSNGSTEFTLSSAEVLTTSCELWISD